MSTENKSETVLSPLEEKLVKELVSEGREKGFITIDEINENLGDESPSAEQLERIFDIFSEMDIEIIDSDKKIDTVQDNIDPSPEIDFVNNDPDTFNLLAGFADEFPYSQQTERIPRLVQ